MPNTHPERLSSTKAPKARPELKVDPSPSLFTPANQQIVIRDALIKMALMLVITGMSRSTYYQRKKDGEDVPQPVPMGGRSVRFLLSEVQSWVEKQRCSRSPS